MQFLTLFTLFFSILLAFSISVTADEESSDEAADTTPKIHYVSDTMQFRSALLDASTNYQDDVITLASGTYKTTDDNKGQWVYYDQQGNSLTVIGEGLVTLSGDGTDPILASSGGTLSVENIIFRDGIAVQSGGAIKSLSPLDVLNCEFYDNQAPTSGGAIYSEHGFLTISNSVFKRNQAGSNWYEGGGAVFSGSGSDISGSLFVDNYAANSGNAGMSVKTDWDSSTKIVSSIFIANDEYSNSAHISILRGSLVAYNNYFTSLNSKAVELYNGTADIYNSVFDQSSNSLMGDMDSKFRVFNSYINESINTGAFIPFFSNNLFSSIDLGFADPANENFELTSDSDLVDQGLSDENTGSYDYMGNIRIVGNSIDIGPVEMTESSFLEYDSDNDGVSNQVDNDDDNDGVNDSDDVFPLDPFETADTDNDGVGNNADAFPTDPSEILDTDEDGVGDNLDHYPHDPSRSESSDEATDTTPKIHYVSDTMQFRSALLDASTNYQDDVITLASGTYKTTDDNKGQWVYYDQQGNSLTVIGEGLVTLSGDGTDPILASSGGTLSVENIIFRDGIAVQSGGAIKSLSPLDVLNCEFYDNQAPTSGGAIYSEHGFLTISNSVFKRNQAGSNWYEGGGAVFSGSGSDISGSLFVDNYAANSGNAGMSVKTDWDSSTKIVSSIFIANDEYSNSAHISILRGSLVAYNNYFTSLNSKAVELYNGTADIYNSVFDQSSNSLMGDMDSKFRVFNSYINESINTGAFIPFFSNNLFSSIDLGFADPANENFELTSDSDLVDQGLSDENTGSYDYMGNIRIVGNSIDIGPVEMTESSFLEYDSDNDGVSNQVDNDDNDGVNDSDDVFPLDPSETADTDNDGVVSSDDLCPDASGISSISPEIDAQPDIESLQFCISFEDSVPTLNFVIDVSDNFSDTTDLGLLYWPEGGDQTWTGLSRQTSESSFKGSISLHPNALSATYAIRAITLTDNFGASLYLNEGELNSLGFNTTTLLDNPNSDSIPPEIVSFDSSGWSIDENGIPQLEAIISVTDEHSGLVNESPILELLSPSGKSIQHRGVSIAANEYKFNVSLPEQAASGVYPVNTIRVYDNAGNSSHGSLWLSENPTSFTLDNPNSDNEKPVINEFFLSASFDNITDRPVIHVDGVASDNLSGVESVYLRLSRPDGRLDRWLTSRQENNNLAFNNLIPLTTGFTPGKYVVDYLRLIDKAGNQIYFSETDLVVLGEDSIPEINIFFPDEIEIEEPNLDIYYSDDSDLDNTSVTDSYVVSSWASVNAQWPGILETELITLTFDGFTEDLSNFPINFSSSSNAAGYDFKGIGCDIASLVETQCGIPENPAQTQIVYVSNIVENGTKRIITIAYASDNPQTTGLGLNIHFDSTQANLIDASIALQNAYVGGTAERDFLFGANASNDQINAGGGDDYIYTGDGDDIVQAGEGNDLIVGGSGLGDDTYEGGEGSDTVSYTSAISPITVDLSQNIAYGLDIGEDQLSGIENIIAGQGNDKLILNDADNAVYAGSGDDEIINDSFTGTDVLYGEDGNDIFSWSSSADGSLTIFGGAGADTFKPKNAVDLNNVILGDFSSEEGDLIDLSDYWENNTHDAMYQIINGDDLSNYLAIENSALVFKLNNITQETILAFSNDIQLEAINTWVDSDGDGIADAEEDDSLDANIGTEPSQLISVAGNPVGVNGHSTKISLSYDTSDGNNQLPSIGFRLHYSSEMLVFARTENSIAYDIIVDGDGPYQDESDFDNDSNTDKYIIFGWAALNGDWPNSSLPASLVEVVFNISWEAFDQASINTPINFSKVSTTEGYNFEATNYTLNVLPGTWDFDGSGHADALTDGLLLLRHTFGLAGEALTNGAVALNSSMTDSDIETAVSEAYVIADIDSNNQVDALTDGLLLLRYLFGLRGDSLVDGAVALNAPRTQHSEIEQYILNHMPVE
jgi:predicted outer membrane repeat protein